VSSPSIGEGTPNAETCKYRGRPGEEVGSGVVQRSMRRGVAAVAGVLAAGFVLTASSVDARPSGVLTQVPADDATSPAVSTGVPSGTSPSVSGDGRFVASHGAPADPETDARTSTIYLTDRESGTTTEVTPVPEGLRSGNSIHPVLAGDGCSLVTVSELALDVFRDDDTGDRWDVYRMVLPHCGGQLGNWELVSTRPDGSTLARDDVGVVDPPAVSRSGTVIAYTHPATELLDGEGVTTVSVVDLERAVADPARSQYVAGMPLASPDTPFVHAGIDQPAISGDGRYVAYRSDAASTDAVPGWGVGPEPGGPATAQVFAWDRLELDPFLAVQLISRRADGEPTAVGAGEPTLSRDGRVVVFTSSDVGLVPAVFPPCADGCPNQVFRVDRDVDANGWFDEPNRTEMTMVSAEPDSSPIVAGRAPSSQPTVSADGQLTAFVTKASNLQVVKASGGGEPDDGDLLLGDARSGELRRVTVQADGVRPAVAAHSAPRLSDTGRTIVFDTLAAPQLVPDGVAGRQVVAISTEPTLSLAEADLGTTLVGFTSDEWYVAVINDGDASFTPSQVSVSDGRFDVNEETSTCTLGVPVPPGGDCTVRLTFTPTAPGPVTATLTVGETGFDAVEVSTTVRGAGGEPVLRTNPAGSDLGEVLIGSASSEFQFDVENMSFVPASIVALEVAGIHPGDFAVTTDSCRARVLNPRATCSLGVTFTPTEPGRRTALVRIVTELGEYTSVVVAGDASYSPSFRIDETEVLAGERFLAGGNGYPPNTEIAVLFDDASSPSFVGTTNDNGEFLVWVPVSPDEYGGVRSVVAQTSDGTVASSTIEVIEADVPMIGVPGFGFGR